MFIFISLQRLEVLQQADLGPLAADLLQLLKTMPSEGPKIRLLDPPLRQTMHLEAMHSELLSQRLEPHNKLRLDLEVGRLVPPLQLLLKQTNSELLVNSNLRIMLLVQIKHSVAQEGLARLDSNKRLHLELLLGLLGNHSNHNKAHLAKGHLVNNSKQLQLHLVNLLELIRQLLLQQRVLAVLRNPAHLVRLKPLQRLAKLPLYLVRQRRNLQLNLVNKQQRLRLANNQRRHRSDNNPPPLHSDNNQAQLPLVNNLLRLPLGPQQRGHLVQRVALGKRHLTHSIKQQPQEPLVVPRQQLHPLLANHNNQPLVNHNNSNKPDSILHRH